MRIAGGPQHAVKSGPNIAMACDESERRVRRSANGSSFVKGIVYEIQTQ